MTYDPAVMKVINDAASRIVWLDSLLMNVDRTARNTNMLMWNKELWLIDHGASLYFHHAWSSWEDAAKKPFIQIKEHVLLPFAKNIEEAGVAMKKLITPKVVQSIVSLLPDEWLLDEVYSSPPSEVKKVYEAFLITRLENSDLFEQEAKSAASAFI
jgi:hypothetical protein